MSSVRTRASEPTHAERVRSIIAAASSLSATVNGIRDDILGADLVRFGGRGIGLHVPDDCLPAREAAKAPAGPLPVVLEWTDVAPVAVQQRLRARVRLTGWLHARGPAPAGGPGMLLQPRQLALATGGSSSPVDPAELPVAEPDPLARFEAALLIHLAEDHQDQVAALTRLLAARELLGVTRVTPLALDRYGIVLRLDYLDGRRDVRLAFTEPLTDADQVGHRIHTLIAHSVRHGRRSTRA